MEISTILPILAMESIVIDILNHYLDKTHVEIGTHEILAIEDYSGITNKAYNNIDEKFKRGAKAIGKRQRIVCLPKSHHVLLL